ncbi:MAG TPA: hypothetical protein VF476_13905 [Chitinophagaceae bacterium]
MRAAIKQAFTSFLYVLLLLSCAKKGKDPTVIVKELPGYPSASAIEYVNGKLYIMGDDATQMLVLDTNLNIIDSVPFFYSESGRVPKDSKQDIESILFLNDSNKLILFGSGSLSPYRDSAWYFDIETKEKKARSYHPLYSTIRNLGIKEINIEGAVKINDEFILANRGHLDNPKNHLLFFRNNFFVEPGTIFIAPVTYTQDSTSFQGISGLTYSPVNDALIMTVSTEQTASVFEDGEIGKSYIWIIHKISIPIPVTEFKPDKIIDLEKIDPVFKGHKIESAAVIGESKNSIRLILVADNDDGGSTVFKLSVKS